MRFRLFIFTVLISLLVSGCASYDFSRRIVQQGNLLPQAKISRLAIGMSKQDAATLMGTSLLSPTFNNNRWDYAYTWRKGSNAPIVRNVSLYFANGRLIRIEHHP
ncbi:outer membrane protein assembly factor BamE [Legionella taurinensis]|uniref:Outer membrane protein assembly factor BamE n=1 Tax=Legionella taurinensis TaxID=70611 RepID=A0A3A5L244_9GAMM|nr:outer membrane protein assembly factor BamE [Legionella taurinensis]MDX1838487.1 outer membrane protein assembly factor BamE [Legionella taurinensis]PUT38929.1 RNA-binding protein [Legionella taurinensis]PUT40990.1 RNA-binding protein [Legionella taurinensis]PUT43222.1 RNA-binding protein [Legionella taurinensis]PUT46408.1 RNA-binding protein [Legionella taurinensis]